MNPSSRRLKFVRAAAGAGTWQPPKPHASRRTLFEMSPMTHCSIIGTCLTVSELRKLVVKIAGEAARNLTDHEIHSRGVGYASVEGLPSKLLTKALDEKHAGAIRKLSSAKDESIIREFWAASRRDGAVEGPYWAVATHPLTSEAFFNEVFGDIHMLSHLVGASNRADIKRLVQLTAERDRIAAELSAAMTRLREGWSRRDRELAELRDQLVRCAGRAELDHNEEDCRAILKRAVHQFEQRLQVLTTRLTVSEDKAAALTRDKGRLERELASLHKTRESLAAEIGELESLLANQQEAALDCHAQIILYVGGMTRSVPSIRRAVEQANAQFLHHDGGQEQAIILLRGLVGRADLVLISADFVSHEAAWLCKDLCTRLVKPFIPLPHAGVGSVLRALRDHLAAVSRERT